MGCCSGGGAGLVRFCSLLVLCMHTAMHVPLLAWLAWHSEKQRPQTPLNYLCFLFLHPVRPFLRILHPQRCSFQCFQQSDAALVGLRISGSKNIQAIDLSREAGSTRSFFASTSAFPFEAKPVDAGVLS